MKKIIPIFIPHIGCPHDCVFCNQKKITGLESELSYEGIRQHIEKSLDTIPLEAQIEIAFFGGSFTAMDQEIQDHCLDIAEEYRLRDSRIQNIRISTRPDAINEEILKRLAKKYVTIIELGVQSMDQEVLIQSNRGHDTQCVVDSAQLIRENGFSLGLQMMTGLPMDNLEKTIATARKIAALAPDFVRIYPVLVIEDTALAQLYRTGKYQAISLEEAINQVKQISLIFIRKHIKIIRMGLQTSTDISPGGSVIAGPFHEAFGELVDSAKYKDFIENYIVTNSIKGQLEIVANEKQISKIAGHKRRNLVYFKDKHQVQLKLHGNQSNEMDSLMMNKTYFSKEQILAVLWYEYFHENIQL